ncbi:MAG TPA: hypothetical protein VIJ28_07220 [Chloroflexota bacterium]|jgi:hypothetical protein
MATTDETISVLIPASAEATSGLTTKALIPLPNGLTGKVVDVSLDIMGDAISEVADKVDALVGKLHGAPQHAKLQEITVALTITGEGGIKWVVDLTGSAQGTLQLTFKVNP